MFVGVEAEYAEMRQQLPKLEYRPVQHFLELAQVIAGSRLFIGNQSFPFAIAEGLKVKRLLEIYHLSPNVNVEGPLGYDFCFQPQFERLVEKLYESD
jgi:ADP-heptose:LPS heptosyltransferase